MARRSLAVLALVGAMVGGNAFADETTGITKDTIKIGMFGVMSGPNAFFGKALYGVDAIYRDVNERGGIHGRKIVVVREDDACDVARGIAAFKKLVAQEQVFMVHGGICSGVVIAARPEIQKAGLPFMVVSAASSAISTPLISNLFHPVATSQTVADTMVDFAVSKPGNTRIAIITHSDEWGKSHFEPAIKRLKERYKLDPVIDVRLERGSTDVTPQVLKLRAAQPQAILAFLYPSETAIFLREANKYALRVPSLGTQGVTLEDTLNRVGDVKAMENFYVFYPFHAAIGSPGMAKWQALATKYYPNEPIETNTFLGMGGAQAIIAALEKAGPNLTRTKFIDALNSIRDLNTNVLSGSITFSPGDHAGVKTGAMARLRDGKADVLKQMQ